jgi:hypothetical protein
MEDVTVRLLKTVRAFDNLIQSIRESQHSLVDAEWDLFQYGLYDKEAGNTLAAMASGLTALCRKTCWTKGLIIKKMEELE